MIRRPGLRATLLLLGAIALPATAGCTRFVQVQETKLLETTPLRRIAILPFRSDLYVKFSGSGDRAAVTCLYDGKTFPRNKVPETALVEVTAIFQQRLAIKGGYDLVKPGDVVAFVKERRLDPKALDPPAFFGAIGRGLGVDAVLAGNVLRYEELHGSSYGAQAPASVTMDVHLIDARTGKMLWEASYAETQSTLTENAAGIGTFVQRGARFLRAHELADWAAGQIVDRFPPPRGAGGGAQGKAP